MLPSQIIVDPNHVDEEGKPIAGASIYLNFIKVHPAYKQKVLAGLKSMYPNQKFYVEEYKWRIV